MSAEMLEAGERVLLIDRKERRYMITLANGKQFHAHHGVVEHDAIIGQQEGTTITSTGGATMIVLRPSLADFILKMPRGAQVVYPKDIGVILVEADIFPGASVIEAGTGSGALTLALIRAVGPDGQVISYDLRDDHSAKARSNLESFLGKLPDALDLRIGDVAEHEGAPADRLVLDLPEPWHALALASRLLRPGGIVCTYLPSTVQVSRAVETMRSSNFTEIRPFEVLIRTWHVDGLAVRPDHRMVAHTGFLTTARFLG